MKTKESINERIEKLLSYLSSVQANDLNSFTEFDFCEEQQVKLSKKKRARKHTQLSLKN